MVDSPMPVFTGEQMARALTAYRDLQNALDRSMPEQIMQLDGKPFRKKGYWRAIAVAFNLTVEPVEERREVNGQFHDGRDNFGYIVSYKATAPNGRSIVSDGSCFAVEKGRRFKCPHLKPGSDRYTVHFPHHTCPDFDPEYQWRVLPGEATEHNVRGHAHTRAFNRAVSNLVGFGEVSAEEVTREDLEHQAPAAAQAPQRRSGAPLPLQQTTTGTTNGAGRKISEAQAKRFFAIAKGAGWSDDELRALLKTRYSVDHSRDLLVTDYEAAITAVQEGSGS